VSNLWDVLFLLQKDCRLVIWRDGRALGEYEHFRTWPDLVAPNLAAAAGSASVVGDMAVVELESFPVLLFMLRDGVVVFYQIFRDVDAFTFKRIHLHFPSAGRPPRAGWVTPLPSSVFAGAHIAGLGCFLVSECGYPRLIAGPAAHAAASSEKRLFTIGPNGLRVLKFKAQRGCNVIGGCLVRRPELRMTPSLFCYAPSWRALVMFLSMPVQWIDDEYDCSAEPERGLIPSYQQPPTPPREIEASPRVPERFEDRYELFLLRGRTLVRLHEFGRHAIGTALAFVHLRDDPTDEHSLLSEYLALPLAVGLSWMCHEERTMRGHIKIFRGNLVRDELSGAFEDALTSWQGCNAGSHPRTGRHRRVPRVVRGPGTAIERVQDCVGVQEDWLRAHWFPLAAAGDRAEPDLAG
jgi:hypothetical protein